VELAAVVEVPASGDCPALLRGGSGFWDLGRKVQSLPPFPSWAPVLGNDILGSWLERLRRLGMRTLWVTSQFHEDEGLHSRLGGFAKQGVERFLLIRRKSYAEMDLADLLRFHHESRNQWTEAHDQRGQLGVTLLDRAALNERKEPEGSPSSAGRICYQFRGYAKRIFSARERQELVHDVFAGACSMRPMGTEVRDQVWTGESVSLHPSARLIGPAYIGSGSVIGAGATVGPFASVEHNCVVDCGTTVERATILPFTYLSPGLLIRDAQVDGGEMEDLTRETSVDLRPARLTSSMPRLRANRRLSWWAGANPRNGHASSAKPPNTWWEVQL
jgi:hypothetical protein